MKIFEELFTMLNHENENIADYGQFILARTTNSNKIEFLNKKATQCSFEIRLIINKIIEKPDSVSEILDTTIKLKADMCYKVVGRDSTGREAYYFVLIDKDKKQDFLRHKVGDNYNLEDYGKIVYSAYGTKVPKYIKEMLKEKYGFDNLGNDDEEDEDDEGIYFSASDFADDDEEE